MATDLKKIIENLLAFCDFKDRTAITVGAGGGQFIEYGRHARHVLALDSDPQALQKLQENLKIADLENKFTPVLGDFFQTHLRGDVVLFEFCLHEMPDPKAAITHARTMAPEIVVIDHWPGSEWSYYTAEDEKVAASWGAMETFPLKKKQKYDAVHFFKDYDELYQKVHVQGEISLARIERFRSHKSIAIPMSYGLALI